MLTELSVQALGVIDRADISLAGGCSALTGETGAGKTLLVAAMGLLLGGRADRTLVREEASEALVEGRFVLPADHPAVSVLVERDVVAIEGTLTAATDQFQAEHIRRAIARSRGNMTDAAERLGLHRSNLYRKMRQLGMAVEERE